jgi:hypothetical protein
MVESNHTNLVTRHIAGKGEMGSTDTLSVHNCTHTGLVERRETVEDRPNPARRALRLRFPPWRSVDAR